MAALIINSDISKVGIYDTALKGLPSDQLWRLFIDYNRQDLGALVFDRQEPGYKAAMEKGFSLIRNSMGEKITTLFIETLHDTCIADVLDSSAFGFNSKKEDPACQYGIGKPTEMARKEWESEELVITVQDIIQGNKRDKKKWLGFCFPDAIGRSYIQSMCQGLDNTISKVAQIIEDYYQRVDAAQGTQEKLEAIARFCRALALCHPFRDGNLRTIIALLTKCLIEQDLSPVILEDPNVLEGSYSASEMAEKLQIGMEIYQKMVASFEPSSL